MKDATLYYFHDPMCSWCWGFSQSLNDLRQGLPPNVAFKRILGGLAPDNSAGMSPELRLQIQSSWRRIEAMIPTIKFNFDYWEKCQPRRSTYPSCRAVIAARQQGEQYDELMTKAIQSAYYQQARNPSLDETLIEIASELKLDSLAFAESLNSASTVQALEKEIQFSRDLDIESFPSLVLQVGEKNFPIALDYLNANTMLKMISIRTG